MKPTHIWALLLGLLWFAPVAASAQAQSTTAGPTTLSTVSSTAGSSPATISVAGYGSCAVTLDPSTSPAWSGTVTFEGTSVGSTQPVGAVLASPGSSPATTASSGGLYFVSVAGLLTFDVRLSANSTGTVNVSIGCASASGSSAGVAVSTTVGLPYSYSTGQSAITASFIGAGGIYYSTLPTLTNGKFNPLMLDASGRLIINCASGCSGSATLTLPYSGTSNGQTATSASFLGAGGLYNSSLPSLSNGQFAPLNVDSSGRLLISPTGLPTAMPTLSPVAVPTGNGAITAPASAPGAVSFLACISSSSPSGSAGSFYVVPCSPGDGGVLVHLNNGGSVTAAGVAGTAFTGVQGCAFLSACVPVLVQNATLGQGATMAAPTTGTTATNGAVRVGPACNGSTGSAGFPCQGKRIYCSSSTGTLNSLTVFLGNATGGATGDISTGGTGGAAAQSFVIQGNAVALVTVDIPLSGNVELYEVGATGTCAYSLI